MKKTLGLKEIYLILRKRLWLIAAITLTAGVIGAIATHFFMTPMYDATTRILVNQGNGKTLYDSNAVQTNVQLVNTYSELIDDPSILNKVIRNLHLNLSAGDLQGMLTVETNQESQIFSITAETDRADLSVRIVNHVANVFKAQVRSMLKVDNVSLLSPATVSASAGQVSPSLSKNVTIAVMLGLLFSVGLAFLLEYLDNTIKTEEDIEQKIGLPVVGIIEHFEYHDKKKRKVDGKSETTTHSEKLKKGRRDS
ncbi:YveK family protein [Sporolactobacillus laevolacticus]|uniref:Capsular polysaccharide biosynthesis protein n=1 Tax=Sporolactobacillus laevolacticus DSM 442 TaxID=1395513 RepID=V6IZ17_9BACL|nr:Wzz/FepE/Etk N-terminal domain-containing protein [Sporolactobacillus laevolacticus]EST12712.1 capsular polysaccharide biosynthesis protein [Sporolactobacillus laevolacticus DSM 442]